MLLQIPNIENLPRKELLAIIEQLTSQNIALALKVEELTQKVEELTKALAYYQHPKNSNNSSVPPSKDENRPKRNKSLREKSGKKPGGQEGRNGVTLQMTDTPDKIEKLIPNYCNKCGKDLSEIEAVFHSKRQVVELPPIKPIYIEYQCFSKQCKCGHKQSGDYPPSVINHIQYGSSVEAMVGYFSAYQYLPFKRMGEMFKHLFNLSISEGSIGNILKRLSNRAQPIYDAIHSYIAFSKEVGGDETGVKVNGDKWWAWIWQNISATYIAVSVSRGKQTVEKLFPKGFINAILNSDRWRTHLNTYAKGHQLCIAHLLRDLNYLIELENTTFAKNLKALFKQGLELKKECSQYARSDPMTLEIETKMDKLLLEELSKKEYPKTLIFQNSMQTYRNYLFTYLYHKDVPPDNNGSERGIRNFKVKQKISGQFKTGQESFAKLRSIIDTCIKRKMPVLEAMTLTAQIPITSGE